jgi:hypothetical protein
MSRIVFTLITPLPASISRETMLTTLHDHFELPTPFSDLEMSKNLLVRSDAKLDRLGNQSYFVAIIVSNILSSSFRTRKKWLALEVASKNGLKPKDIFGFLFHISIQE